MDPNVKRFPSMEDCTVYEVHQDKDGVIWVGSDCGLHRLAGNEIRNLSDSLPVPTPEVFSIEQSKGGTLWFGTNNGLVYYDGTWNAIEKTFTKFVPDVMPESNSSVLVSTLDGVYKAEKNGRCELIEWPKGKLRKFGEFEKAGDGRLWYHSQGRFVDLADRDGGAFQLEFSQFDNRPLSMAAFKEYTYFVVDSLLYKLSDEPELVLTYPSRIFSLYANEEFIFFSTADGICKVVDSGYELLHECDPLRGFTIDKEGGVWTKEGTVSLQRLHSQTVGLSSVHEISATETTLLNFGNGWFLLEGDVLHHNGQTIVEDPWLGQSIHVKMFYEASSDRWWFGGHQSFAFAEEGELIALKTGVGAIKDLMQDEDEVVFTSSHGLYKIRLEELAAFMKYGQPSNQKEIIEWGRQYRLDSIRGYSLGMLGHDNFIWSNQKGVYHIQGQQRKRLVPYNNAGFCHELAIISDSLYCGLLGKNGFGVGDLEGNWKEYHFEGLGLFDVTVDENKLYLSTAEGVLLADLPKRADHELVFRMWEGLTDVRELRCFDGGFFLLNQNALYQLNHAELLTPISDVLKHRIYSVKVKGDLIEANNDFEIEEGDRIEFYLETDRYEQSFGAHFEYRLNLQDSSWIPVSGNTLSFEQLSEGSYNLETRVVYPYAPSVSKPIRTKFTVIGPWWKTSWAAALMLFILFGFVFLVISRRLRQQQVLLAANNRALAMRNEALRSQLNSHFIYNAMNSLQASIVKAPKKDSLNIVQLLARHMRRVFDLSAEDFIALDEELSLLKDYLELEKMRFRNRLSYIIEPLEINLNEIQVPPMIIQPIVENSVKYGLPSREEDFEVRVSVFQKNTSLVIEVSDNGAGSTQAELNGVLGRSSGLKNIKERLASIRKGSGELKHEFLEGDKGQFKTVIVIQGIVK